MALRISDPEIAKVVFLLVLSIPVWYLLRYQTKRLLLNRYLPVIVVLATVLLIAAVFPLIDSYYLGEVGPLEELLQEAEQGRGMSTVR